MDEDYSRTALYRLYDANDRLLYVGISERLGTRWEVHMRLKPWWTEVHRQTVKWYPTRDEAAAQEAAAIAAERPLHNVRHSTRLLAGVVLSPEWTCSACRWSTTDLGEQLDHMEAEARRHTGNRLPALRAEYLMRQIVRARKALAAAAASLNQGQGALDSVAQRRAVRHQRRTIQSRPDIDATKLLRDLDNVMGHERIRLSELPALLRQADPEYLPYRRIKGTHINEILRGIGVRVTNTDNIGRLDPADLRREAR